MSVEEKAKKLIELVGGKENVVSLINCMTRCRFTLKDRSLVNEEELKQQDFVLGIHEEGEQYQVIVGPGNAAKMVQKINDLHLLDKADEDSSFEEEWQANKQKVKKQTPTAAFLKKIGEIFLPMIPGFIAAGLFLGFANILGNIALSNSVASGVPVESLYGPLYYFFNAMGLALYGYLVIFTGINTARVFGGTEILGGIVGGFILSPTLTPLALSLVPVAQQSQGVIDFANTLPGKGGIFGVMFAVMFMSFIEQKIRRIMPGMIELILTPLLTLFISGIATVGFMVFAGFLTDWIGIILNFLVNTNGFISVVSGAVIAGFFLPLVTLGLHQGLTPIYLNEIAMQGATYIFPIAAMAGAGQVGASASIFLQARKLGDSRMEKIISGAMVPGILGVGEPLIYGVTLPLGKPFMTAGIGAACGGAWIAFAHVGAVATGPSGLTALPLILPEDIVQYLIGILIAYVGGFIFTHILYKYQGTN